MQTQKSDLETELFHGGHFIGFEPVTFDSKLVKKRKEIGDVHVMTGSVQKLEFWDVQIRSAETETAHWSTRGPESPRFFATCLAPFRPAPRGDGARCPAMALHGEIGLDRGLMDVSIVCAIGVALSIKWTACASQLRDPFLVGGDVAYASGELLTRVRLSPSRAPTPVAPPTPGRSPAARYLLDPSN